VGGVENIQMAYFLPFGAGLIALHTISILFVSRISLIKRLFLVVWVMLFAIGAPFLFQQVPGIAFVGLCALALAVYMVLLFSQELAPVKKKATASTRSRSQKHAKSSRKKVQAKEASLSSARDLNFSNASTGRMRKESKERVQAEESPVRQRVSASGRTLADRSIKKDMTRYEKVKPLYPVDNLATAPAFGEYEPNSQLAAAEVGMVGMEHSSQKANDEFLQSLLHHRKGSTKIKVANSLIQPTEANAAGNQGYTDIDDPAFETAVLSIATDWLPVALPACVAYMLLSFLLSGWTASSANAEPAEKATKPAIAIADAKPLAHFFLRKYPCPCVFSVIFLSPSLN